MNTLIFLAVCSIAFGSVIPPPKNSCAGGDWFRCAGTVADCWNQCGSGVFTKTCMDCCGDAWDQCSKCFEYSKHIPLKLPNNKQIPNSCTGGDWFRCAGIVADCWNQCDAGVFTKTCMDCCGDAWDSCSKCFDDKKKK